MPNYKSKLELKRTQRHKREKNHKIGEIDNFQINASINAPQISIYNEEVTATSTTYSTQSLQVEEVSISNIHLNSCVPQNETAKSISNQSIEQKLSKWAIEHKIKREALSDLLKILQEEKIPNLPKSYKTLLNTPRNINLVDITPGKMVYMGMKIALESLMKNFNQEINYLEIDLNFDGAPIYENSKNNVVIWPILARVYNIDSEVFPVAIYGGSQKPDNFNELLKPFVEEFNNLTNNFTYQERKISLKIRIIILDTPAKASICCITGHMGYFPCPKCHIRGERVDKRIVFPRHQNDLRTNHEFREKLYSNHNKKKTELEEIKDLDLVKNIPIDYMHCVLLGVMRKLLDLWFGKHGLYPPSCKKRLSEKIEKYEKSQPSDFERKLRSLDKMGLWKANELRTFLLYIGPVVLKHDISQEQFQNFMLLHIAIKILCDKENCTKFNATAQQLIDAFVEGYEEIYGTKNVTFNIHILTHLPADCMLYGNLDNFSAFPFEAFMGQLKRYVASPFRPLEQIFNRYMEKIQLTPLKCNVVDKIFHLEKQINATNFSRCRIGKTTLSGKLCDSYVMLTDEKTIMKIDYFTKEEEIIYAMGIKFTNILAIYDLPISSKDVNEFKIMRQEFVQFKSNVENICRKFYVFDVNSDYSLLYGLSQFMN